MSPWTVLAWGVVVLVLVFLASAVAAGVHQGIREYREGKRDR